MKRTIFCIFSFLLVFNTILFAQSITWEKTLLYSNFISGYSIKHTSDGNYITCGKRANYGSFILKLNTYGDTIWLKQYFNITEFYSIIEDYNGNYLAIGLFSDVNSDYAHLIKLNQNGNTEWTKLIFEPGFKTYCYSINNTIDSNFILSGSIRADNPTRYLAFYIKLDENGNKVWSNSISSQTGDKGLSYGKQLNDGTYIFTGNIMLSNYPQIFFVRSNINGDTLWTNNYGNINNYETGNTVFQTMDKGFLLIGNITYTNQNKKLIFVKTDSSGNYSWGKTYGDTNLSYQLFFGDCAVKNVLNNSFIVTGRVVNIPAIDTLKVFLLNIDSLGNKLWEKTYKKDTLNIGSWSIDNCNDSGFIISGNAYTLEQSNLSDPPSLLYILKTDKNGEIKPIGINSYTNEVPKNFRLFQNYPNPFNPMTSIKYEIPREGNIKLTVYDITGREIISINEYRQAGVYTYTFDGTNLASGMYFYRIIMEGSGDKFVATKKMVIVK